MKIVEPDFDRKTRCGIPEIVYGEYKTKNQLVEIAKKFINASGRVIITKLNEEKADYICSNLGEGLKIRYDIEGQVMVAAEKDFEKPSIDGCVSVITAGTSDIKAAQESRIILEELGCQVETAYDVGVAGVHRVYSALEDMKEAGCLIVVAGMEGALPSVVSGLVDVPVIGLPTSVGYGVGEGGEVALKGMLSACTPIAVVNIDNGYGAAVLAYQIVRER